MSPSTRPPALSYVPPCFDRAIILEEHVRALPAHAATRGLFFLDLIEQLRKHVPNHPLLLPGAIAGRRYVPFNDYGYPDYLQLLYSTAQAIYPNEFVGEGLRRLGRGSYVALLNSQVGKVIFGAFGDDVANVIRLGSRGYEVFLNFGKVEVEVLGPEHIRYFYHDMPAFIETYQVGVIEGAMLACHIEGEVLVHITNLGNASFDIRWWTPRRSAYPGTYPNSV